MRRVFSPSFLGDVEFEAAFSRSILGVKMASCSIGLVRGAVQVVIIGLQEIRNIPEVRVKDEVSRSFSDK